MVTQHGLKIAFLVCAVGFALMSSAIATAATVEKIKGSAVLISLDGDTSGPGDEFFAMDGGKRKGIIRVAKVKGDKATAKLIKGKAQAGWSLKLKKQGSSSASSGSMDETGGGPRAKNYIGGLFGFANESMSVKLDTGESVALAGSGMALKGFYDMQMSDDIWLRAQGGYFTFATSKGTASAGCNNEPCKVNISYLSLDIWGRYLLGRGNFKPWVGVGFDLVFPMSIEVNAVEKSTVKNSSIITLGGGADWMLSRTSFVPIVVEYGMFPSSSSVSATYMAISVGYGMAF